MPEILLIDGDCSACRKAAAVLRPHLAAGCEVRSFREPGALEGLPVDAARCEEALQLVEADGRVSGGLEAAVRATRGSAAGLVLGLYYAPGLRQVLDAGYAWVARRRRAWGGYEGRGGR